MSLRTPRRRRISPRTKQRYFIVRNFFRRAIGNTPRKENSAEFDSNLNFRILGNNEQFDDEQYEIATRQDANTREKDYKNERKIKRYGESYAHHRRSREDEACVQSRYHSDIQNIPKEHTTRPNYDGKLKSVSYNCHYDEHYRRGERSTRHGRKEYDESITKYTSSTKRSEREEPQAGQSDHRHEREARKQRTAIENKQYQLAKHLKRMKRNDRHQSENVLRNQEESTRNAYPILDKQFIDDIIRKQYNTVQVYCNSQLSAPVCRDLVHSLEKSRRKPTDLCPCIEGNIYEAECSRRCAPNHVNSVTCLSPTDERQRSKLRTRKKKFLNESSDLSLDLVPVKENSSPKSRCRFVDNNPQRAGTAEIPPSPTNHRPRFNLRAQCLDYDDTGQTEISDTPRSNIDQYNLNLKHMVLNKTTNESGRKESNEGVSDRTNSNYIPDQASHFHKNDATLTEIKDIIQSFLQEIKKESVADSTQGINKVTDSSTEQGCAPLLQQTPQVDCPSQYPCAPPCYPVLPMCSMNCGQTSYMPPKINYSCPHCQPDTNQNHENPVNDAAKTSKEEMTPEDLLKEIYKIMTLKKESAENTNETSDANIDCQSDMSNKCGPDLQDSISGNFESVDSRAEMENDASVSVIDRLSVMATRTDAPLKVDSLIVTKKKSSLFNKLAQSLKILKGKKEKLKDVTETRPAIFPTNANVQNNCYPCPGSSDYKRPGYSPNINLPQPLYYPLPPPTAPPYYEAQPWNIYPQIPPLCVKEVEVKSVGTQSDIKLSIFQKFGLKANSKPSICIRSKKMAKDAKMGHYPDWKDSPLFSRKQNTFTDELQAALLKTLLLKNSTPKYPWMKGYQPKPNKYLNQMMKYCKES